ncbi:MAG: hypothetical protein HZC14_00455 [Candidatus Niyogibacteria bacterium]|nr:hypothetical protein [Candidatus Niyogibacteria bacterium]
MDLKNNNILLVAVALILVAGFSGYYMGMQKVNKVEAELARYQKALEMFVPPAPNEILSVGGTIKEIGDGFVVVESPSLSKQFLPGEEVKVETRRITVDGTTEFTKIDPLALPTQEDIKNGQFAPKETKITLSDLKAGDSVTVEASENIKTKMDFTAKKIVLIVQPKFVAPELPPELPELPLPLAPR